MIALIADKFNPLFVVILPSCQKKPQIGPP